MMLGGTIGFGIGVGFGLLQGNAWPSILWHAAVAAYVAGMLMRWWGRVWFSSLKAVQHDSQGPAPVPGSKELPSHNRLG